VTAEIRRLPAAGIFSGTARPDGVDEVGQAIIRFGIVGCGMIANWHAKAINSIPGACLTGVADASEKAAGEFAVKYGIRAYRSVDSLLSDPEIDVVCICTPSGWHASLAITAANRGKHVVVEKPMALNLEEADRMIEACQKNKVKMEVICQLRFSDAAIKIKDALDKALFGRLVCGDMYMKFFRSDEYYQKGGWRGTWAMDGGGALMNQGIHGVDLLCHLMGPVQSVFARCRTLVRKIEVEDTAAAILTYKNGAIGVIQATTSIYPGFPRRLEISGDRGTVVMEDDILKTWIIERQDQPVQTENKSKSDVSSDPSAFGIEGHIKQITDMTDAIRYDREPLINQYEGRKAIEIIRAVYDSSESGQVIDLHA
jgi:UDP-N-acetyl-2-amino-2-deoxyglucuronate dehydrogenase